MTHRSDSLSASGSAQLMALPEVVPGVEAAPAGESPVPNAPSASSRLRTLPTLVALVAVLIAVVHLVVLTTEYRHLFVHPDWHQQILPQSLRDGLSIGLSVFPNAMQLRGEGESRPRWLTYLILALDQKSRLWLYEWVPVHPTFAPVTWFLQLIVTPYFLYRLLMNVTRDRAAALAGLAVYLSSTGLLSGITMQFMPGKTLSNTITVLALYAGSVAVRALRPGQLLVEAKGASKYILLAVLLLGLFLDEMPIATFAIVPLFFWEWFVPPWPWTARLGGLVKGGLFLTAPVLAFLFVVVFIAPPIIASMFGFQFDYLGDTLLIGGNTRTGASVLEGRVPLSVWLILENASILFGLSLSPWQLSPMIVSEFGPFPGSQETNLPKIVIFGVFFGVAALVAARFRGALAVQLRGLLVGIALFMIFISALSIRHIPLVTGYYYGAMFASLFAILVAMLVHGVSQLLPSGRLAMALVALTIVGIQIVNFGPINDGWIVTHNEQLTRAMMKRQPPGLQNRIPLRPPQDLSAEEVSAIWSAWKSDRLDRYMRDKSVSTAALYEVFELREIDRANRPR